MKNLELAQSILNACLKAGVREVVTCAGARNAPLISLLAGENPFQIHPFFEERSAGFFALGRMMATGRPVAVLTTSGTAVAELLPATIESDYQGQPLILITADRPRRYRGTGAPQTIDQVGIFSHYVEKSFDLEEQGLTNLEVGRRPIHINVCFDEPLLDGVRGEWATAPEPAIRAPIFKDEMISATGMKRPLVLVGGLSSEARGVAEVLRGWQRPVYLEGPSKLRGTSELSHLEILGGERALKDLDFDGVIRIGSVPTPRLWRDLEAMQIPVLNFSNLGFSGLARESRVYPLESLNRFHHQFESWSADEKTADREWKSRREKTLVKYPLSEPAWVNWLSDQIPDGARVFAGNSLPIREWDFAACRGGAHEIFANRGANGIDGLVSTFIGMASEEKSNWAILGDLSAMYDLSGPWAARTRAIRDLNLVIINNGGGKIFHRMFREELFENRHEIGFEPWAKFWGWDYLRLETTPSGLPPANGPRVIEIVPSNEQTEKFWNEWENPR